MSRAVVSREPGIFVPVIDRTKCEGGYHGPCAVGACPCVSSCPNALLEIRRLTVEDRRRFSLVARLRAWIHGDRQVYVVREDGCTACGLCVRACPVKGVIRLRRRMGVSVHETPVSKFE